MCSWSRTSSTAASHSTISAAISTRSPKSVEICALLVKEGEQRVALDLRYIGFTIPPEFVVGYGLDVAERYRNLRGVHRYKGEDQ